MSQYLETETEEDRTHSEDDNNEITYQEMLVANGVIEYGDTILGQEEAAARAAIASVQMVPRVCSCGSMRCGMIVYYGLPEPVYHSEIKPLPTVLRDPTAQRMKQSGI
jgi:hypothetical protein